VKVRRANKEREESEKVLRREGMQKRRERKRKERERGEKKREREE